MIQRGVLRGFAAIAARAALLGAVVRLARARKLRRGAAGRPAFPFVVRHRTARFQILLYHRVNDVQDPFFDTVPVAAFERQMTLLRDHFRVLPLEDLVERKARNDVPDDAVAITFDDGYRDNFENAFPVLRRLGLPATIFVTTGTVGSKAGLWHDRVLDAFRQTGVAAVSIDGKPYPLRYLAERREALRACLGKLRRSDPRARDAEIERIIAALEVPEAGATGWNKLDWDQIAVMSNAGITFGAHTVTHPILTRVTPGEAVTEIADSRRAIESRLGRPVRLFAYPNGGRGDFDEAVKRAVRDAGFACGATALPGVNDLSTDPYELRRDGMWDPAPRMALLRLAWSRFAS
jgi:peptidoglycan/xylan/chitin deacetylase (PgdA/CDA1 family)